MSAIERAVNESINYDRIGVAIVTDMEPTDVFDEAKDASPDFDADGNELVFDWNDITQGDGPLEFDIWAMSEKDSNAGNENYFWRINVRIDGTGKD
jgi:hypothetical protein